MLDTAFEMTVSRVRFGPGVTAEVGQDLAEWGARRVAVITDACLSRLLPVQRVLESLEAARLSYSVFDAVRIEPTDESFREAAEFATVGEYDAFVAVGGGSAIDTAKAANLYSTWPADLLDYVNPPLGRAKPVPGPLKPLIAVPTTAGTGSETTGTAVFDHTPTHTKTGITSRLLRPTLGILDPDNTRTAPAAVAASAGLDVLTHAVESYTAIPFDLRPRPESPGLRPAYQGSNPISDTWSLEALRLVARYLQRAVEDPSDDAARSAMILAASYAGVGFGNAGVHLPHAMSYPVSGMIRDYRAEGYPVSHPLVPHGVSVILNAPAAFRFTAAAAPEKHLHAAEVLGASVAGAKPEDAGAILADCIAGYMQRLRTPNGLKALGYSTGDVARLVKGAVAQQRLTKLSPRPAGEDDFARMFENAMVAW